MRADENKSARRAQLDRLRTWMGRQTIGEHFPISTWYRLADQLGLGRADTQRISDLRKEGFVFDYKTKERCYVYRGKEEIFQLELV